MDQLGPQWTKNPLNNADEGKICERMVAVATFLTLKDGQKMVCEMKEADKFDDVVVQVENGGFYLRQVKHKQDDNYKITENDLFEEKNNKKGPFNLDSYLSSFLKRISKSQPFELNISLVKELNLTTNVDFDPSLIQKLELANSSQVWTPLDDKAQSKRFKFNPTKVHRIKKKLMENTNKPTTQNIDMFLEKLVFEVKQPSLSDMKILIKQKIRSLIPIELNKDQAKKACKRFQKKLRYFFENLKGQNRIWASVQLRQDFLLDIMTQLKETVKIGSTINFEGNSLLPILQELNFSLDFPHSIQESLLTSFQKGEFCSQNIVVTPETSLPVIASSIILSHFRRRREFDFRKFWVVDVKSENDCLCFANIFKHHNVEVFRGCIFVVEFSQELGENCVSEVVTKIFDHLKNHKFLVKFILITSQALKHNPNEHIESFQKNHDYYLYDCIMEEARMVLSQKTLLLKNGPPVSLSKLGIQLLSLDSLSLSELVLADKNSQIDLFLPSYDEEMEETYVHRKLWLPVINTSSLDKELKNRLCFDGNDYDDTIKRNTNHPMHLLRSIETLKIPHEKSADLFLLSKSNKVGIDELRGHVSQKSVDEDFMIKDSTIFEKSHNIKAAVVVDLPGMGKSSLLTHLCNAVLQDLNNTKDGSSMKKLVLRVNLGVFNKETWKFPLENEFDVIQFLFAHSQSTIGQKTTDSKRTMTHLSKSILKGILGGRSAWSIIIMLDGYDEISNLGRDFIKDKLLHLLMRMKGVDRIIVVSRPDGGVHESLETFFNQFSLHLVEIDSNDQVSLLVALWSGKIREMKSFSSIYEIRMLVQCKCTNVLMHQRYQCKCLLQDFANRLISKARNHLKDEDKTILDVPLQCKLFAECFYDDLNKYIQESCCSPDIDGNFDIIALFEKFLDHKCHISYYEKRISSGAGNDKDEEMYREYKNSVIEKAMCVSVYYMTRDKEIADCLLGEKWQRKKFKQDMIQVGKLGLVAYFNKDALDDEIVTSFGLIHRTFAEYLVAKYLINAFKETKYSLLDCDRSDCYKIILDILLFKDEYEGIRRFYFRMVLPLMPDLTMDGCPFGTKDRKTVVEKWTVLSHEKFNDALTKQMRSGQSNDSLKEEFKKLYKRIKINDISLPLLQSITWLTLCLKEHVARNLTKASTASFIEAFFEKTCFFFSHTPDFTAPQYLDLITYGRATIRRDSDFSFLMRKFRSVLLTWYVHTAEAEKTKTKLNNCLFKSIEAFLNSLDKGSLSSIYPLGAVSFVVTRQQGFGLKEDQVNEILKRIFKKGDISCLASFLILKFDVWSAYLVGSALRNIWKCFYFFDRLKKGDFPFHNDYHIDFFKEVLEIGSPEFRAGDTSLLNLQIDWFLSLGFRGERFMPKLSDKEHHQKRDLMNPFLIECVYYLLLAIDRYIKDEDEANNKRRRVMTQALQMDVRILKWLKHESIFLNHDDRVENENIAIRKAIEGLSKFHQVAHYGKVSIIMQMKQSNVSCHELFEWGANRHLGLNAQSSSILLEDHNSSEVQTLNTQQERDYDIDWTPPALYLAAANNQVEFIHKVLDRFIKNDKKDKFKSFVSMCINYALVCCNDESIVLPFLDKAMVIFTKEEFCEIFPLTEKYYVKLKTDYLWESGNDRESQILFILAIHGWSGCLIKFIEFSVNDVASVGIKRGKVTKLILKMVDFLTSKQRNIVPCAHVLLVHALKIAEEAGVIHQEFYTSVGLSVCCYLIKGLKKNFLQIATVQELEYCLRKILSNICEKVNDQEFIKFISGSKNAFGGMTSNLIRNAKLLDTVLLNDIVNEFIPRNLTYEGMEALIDIITDVDKLGISWLMQFIGEGESAQRDEIFNKVAKHLLSTNSGTRRFEKIALSTVYPNRTYFLIVHLFCDRGNAELTTYLRSAMDEKWAKRVKILKMYAEDVLSTSLSNSKFKMDTLLTSSCLRRGNSRVSDSSGSSFSLEKLENLFVSFFDDCPILRTGESLSSCWMDVAINVLKYLSNQVQIMLTNPERENVLSTCFLDKNHSERDRFRLLVALTFVRELINTTLDEDNDYDLHQSSKHFLEELDRLRISSSLKRFRNLFSPKSHTDNSTSCIIDMNNLFVSFTCLRLTREFHAGINGGRYESFPCIVVERNDEIFSFDLDGEKNGDSFCNSIGVKNENSADIINKLVIERKLDETFEYFLKCMRKEIRKKYSSHLSKLNDKPDKVCHGLVKFLLNVAIENRWIM